MLKRSQRTTAVGSVARLWCKRQSCDSITPSTVAVLTRCGFVLKDLTEESLSALDPGESKSCGS